MVIADLTANGNAYGHVASPKSLMNKEDSFEPSGRLPLMKFSIIDISKIAYVTIIYRCIIP